MCLLKDAFFGFLTLIVTLSDDMRVASKPIHDPPPIINVFEDSEDSDDYLIPLLRELKSLKSHLEHSTSLGLLRIYGNYIKQMRASNLQVIEDRLTSINTTFQLLHRIYRLLLNYQCELNQIQEYDLKTVGDFSQQINERKQIFEELKDYLNLALIELKNVLDDMRGFKKQTKHFCKMNLVAIFSNGDLGTMKSMDHNFVKHLKSFLDLAISLVKRRQILDQGYYILY